MVEQVTRRRRRSAWRYALLLALANLWVALKVGLWGEAPAWWSAATAVLFGASALAICNLIISRRHGEHGNGSWKSWAGYTALGMFSTLFVLALGREFGVLAAEGLGAKHWAIGQLSAYGVVLAGLAMTVAGFFSATRTARVRSIDIKLDGLTEALHGLRIAQLTDLHAGGFVRRPYVERIVDRINALEPDLVVLTGDIGDGNVEHAREHCEPLRRLRARHGVLAVLGNHEVFHDAKKWVGEFERLGMRVLVNEHVVIEDGGAKLVVAGVMDPSAIRFCPDLAPDAARALEGAPQEADAKILLAHQPKTAMQAKDLGFDLALVGHTHGGQQWPWNILLRFQQPVVKGLARMKGMVVYVSTGAGFWGPPKRVMAPSEIPCLRLLGGDVRKLPAVREGGMASAACGE